MKCRCFKTGEVVLVLTEHGHVLPGVEVPVAPVGPVAVQRCVLLMIVSWLRPKRVDHTNVTSVRHRTATLKHNIPVASYVQNTPGTHCFNIPVDKLYINTLLTYKQHL